MRASEWRVLALRHGMWDMIGCSDKHQRTKPPGDELAGDELVGGGL